MGVSTTVGELKWKVAEALGLQGVEKVRLLYRKKPVGDARSVLDVLAGDAAGAVEFGVMVIGGLAAVEARGESANTSTSAAPVAQGESGEDVLVTDGFWNDLRGFLEQRVRNTQVAERAEGVFREAWKNR